MRNRRQNWTVTAAAVTALLVLTSCSAGTDGGGGDPTSGENAGGEGVEWGASKEDYIAAFDDVEPINLIVQTTGAAGSSASAREEAYYAAIEEYSGGKVTFDLNYSYAIAPPTEVDDAIADGRIDIAIPQQSVEPDKFPVFNLIQNLSFLSTQSPVTAVMQANAWQNEVAYATEEFFTESADARLFPIIPLVTLPPNALLCSKDRSTLEAAEGAQTLASGTSSAVQLEAIGMTPVSIPHSEQYESLQRGVIDCVSGSIMFSAQSGVLEVANYVHYANKAGITHNSGNLSINIDVWNDFPLIVQQLFYDRTDAFYQQQTEDTWTGLLDAVDVIDSSGGAFVEFDEESQNAMIADGNEKILAESAESPLVADPAGLVELAQTSSDQWREILESLGYPDELAYADLAAWVEAGEHDLQEFTDALFEEYKLENRPGN